MVKLTCPLNKKQARAAANKKKILNASRCSIIFENKKGLITIFVS